MSEWGKILNQVAFCPLCGGLLDESSSETNMLVCPTGHTTFKLIDLENDGTHYEARMEFRMSTTIINPILGQPPF